MSTSHTKTLGLVRAVFEYLIGLDQAHFAPFLADWPSSSFTTRTVPPRWLPVLSYLPDILPEASAGTKRIVRMLHSLAQYLAWGQSYTPEDFGAAFLEKYGWTELIGERGPVASNEIACGFLSLGPGVEYPKHSHEAEEVYIPLSAGTFWVKGGEEWVRRPSGVPIYHSSWQTHGMRTESKPLLALYLWRGGNLVQKSRID